MCHVWTRGGAVSSAHALQPARALQNLQDTARIELRPVDDRPTRPITLDEIVALREVHEPRLSPQGGRVAFVIRQAFRDCNCYRTALYVVDTTTNSVPRKLLEENALAAPALATPERQIRWTPDGRFISYLSARSGSVQLWRVSPDGGAAKEVFHHGETPDRTYEGRLLSTAGRAAVGVLSYEWSPNGQYVAFTAQSAIDSAWIAEVTKAGVIYNERSKSGFFDLLDGHWTDAPTQVWVYDVAAHQERQIWQTPGPIGDLAWSPDGTRLAVSYDAPQRAATTYYNTDLGLLSVVDGTFTPLVVTDTASEADPIWSLDGRTLAFYSRLDVTGSSYSVINIASGARREVTRGVVSDWGIGSRAWWVAGGKELLFASDGLGKRRERAALYTVTLKNGAVRRLTSPTAHVSECDGPAAHHVVCIVQSSNIAPTLALVDLSDGSVRSLVSVNPELSHIRLGEVTELRWTNRYKAETTGYLIKPLDYQSGRRYPLVIIAYGFSGKFVTQAEWLTSYPAQVFAQHGFAVLMVNYPRWEEWSGNDFARGSIAWGYSPMASVEAAVQLLVRQGLIDSSRVGMMGTSYGGTITEIALTHSGLLRAAVTTNGSGAFTPALYSLRRPLGALYEHVLGGPPWGATLKHWLAFSPMYNAHRVRAPVLMEFAPREAVFAHETFAAFRRHGVPVELVLYPDDGHVLMLPEHRMASMQRNLDWFNFWLQGREDPDPLKQEQYGRWRGMRRQLDSLLRHLHGK